ncbi:flagellin [Sinirhodobacter populi]|uniref:Flagellin n=1 Tax=Paenirhodobacter populi TaxID=2306993 RepID=A0A443KLX7_9RHOB|nr:flagellin [Sinirhodobacter populi]RWR33832.1 flagellin [Sinirhodobacter populi]
MTSIITNTSAMTALQTLKSINSNLASAQNEISTGKTISTAKDNAAIWSITKVMESDVSGIDAIKTALDLGGSSVSVAREATESVVTDLKSMQSLVVQAQAENVDRATLQTQIDNLKATIANYVSSAQFNGLNFLNDSSEDPVNVLAALNRDSSGTVTTSTISINRMSLSYEAPSSATAPANSPAGTEDFQELLDGIIVDDGSGNALDSDTLQYALEFVNKALSYATNVASYYGAKESQISSQSQFMGKLSDAMTTGIGTLVDADMEEASARLTALQTQQQLGIQALSIANQTPQNILALFR